ncbi:MAG: hypothetical protein QXF35_04545 [Candidatus Bilamarchaeaceae archaeon]
MECQPKKIIVGFTLNCINNKTEAKILTLINTRAKLITPKTKFNAKLLTPDEFERNEAIKNGKIASSLRILLPLVKSDDDYLPLMQMLEYNIKNLDFLLGGKVKAQTILAVFNKTKENTTMLECKAFKEEIIKEEKRLLKNYLPDFVKLNKPNIEVVDQIKNIIKLNNNQNFYFRPLIINNLNETEEVANLILISYAKSGLFSIAEISNLMNNMIHIKEGEDVKQKIKTLMAIENLKQKNQIYFVYEAYNTINRIFSFKLKNENFNNHLVLFSNEKNFFSGLDTTIKQIKREGIAKIIKINELTETIYKMTMETLQPTNKNQEKDSKELKKLIDNFFNYNYN